MSREFSTENKSEITTPIKTMCQEYIHQPIKVHSPDKPEPFLLGDIVRHKKSYGMMYTIANIPKENMYDSADDAVNANGLRYSFYGSELELVHRPTKEIYVVIQAEDYMITQTYAFSSMADARAKDRELSKDLFEKDFLIAKKELAYDKNEESYLVYPFDAEDDFMAYQCSEAWRDNDCRTVVYMKTVAMEEK